MAWTTWTPSGTQITAKFGTVPTDLVTGLVIAAKTGVDVESLLGSPMTKHLVAVKDGKLVALGATPEFPITPRWRKFVRTIG